MRVLLTSIFISKAKLVSEAFLPLAPARVAVFCYPLCRGSNAAPRVSFWKLGSSRSERTTPPLVI